MQSPCSHCHSSRHNLCEPGFTVKLASTPWSETFTLLKGDFLLIPMFEDGHLGPFSKWVDQGSAGAITRAHQDMPANLVRNVCGLQEDENTRLLLAAMGKNSQQSERHFCELAGSALEAAVNTGSKRLVFPLLDLAGENSTSAWWQIQSATLRCRLATLIRSFKDTGALNEVLVVVRPDKQASTDAGLHIDGPFCQACPEPRLYPLSFANSQPESETP